MRCLALIILLASLASCASGPVFVAKNESEGIRASYQDPKLNELSVRNKGILQAIYRRYERANIDVYPSGIGFTTLFDDDGQKYYYLLVDVRPRDITFGQELTKPQERFGEVFRRHFENNIRYVKAQDLQIDGVDGLAFAIHWPVRDLSQCDKYGGFLEYALIYFPKADFLSLANGETSFSDAVKKAEVITSLNLNKPDAVRVRETR